MVLERMLQGFIPTLSYQSVRKRTGLRLSHFGHLFFYILANQQLHHYRRDDLLRDPRH